MRNNLRMPLLVLFGLLVALAFTCSERTTGPVEGTTDDDAYQPDQNQAGYFWIQQPPAGGPLSRPVGTAVIEADSILSRITCSFATTIDTTTLDSAFSLTSASGDEVALRFEVFAGVQTLIYIWPESDLEYGATYVFAIQSAHLRNVAGQMLDADGDRRAGETPDDDFVRRFTTITAGDAFADRDHDGVYDNLRDTNGDHVWESFGVGEPFTDNRPYNNVWDEHEIFTDINNNGRYDAGEVYQDNNLDGVFTPNAEALQDSNHNGFADLGEFYWDRNGDSTWNPAEVYTDVNSNDQWDDTELRYDFDGDGRFDPADGDYFLDVETVNSVCDYAEPFINADHDSTLGPASDSTGSRYMTPDWDDEEPPYSQFYDYNDDGRYTPGRLLIPDSVWAFNPFSAGLKRVFVDGVWTQLQFAGFVETFTDSNGDSIWNPADTYQDAITNGLWDAAGEQLTRDLNGDGGYDPAVPGIPVPPTADNLPPVAEQTIHYLVGEVEVDSAWMDVSIALGIGDVTYDETGRQIFQALPSAELDAATVLLRERDSREEVAGTVTYDNVVISPNYGRLTFNPGANLRAGGYYELVLKAEEITDPAGNKLRNTGDLIYSFRAKNATYDGAVVVDDITPPSVLQFADNGPTFTLFFTEEIDVATANAASISVTFGSQPNAGTFIFGRVAAPSPTGFATTVTFVPNNPSMTGDRVTLRGTITDISGNRMGTTLNYYW